MFFCAYVWVYAHTHVLRIQITQWAWKYVSRIFFLSTYVRAFSTQLLAIAAHSLGKSLRCETSSGQIIRICKSSERNVLCVWCSATQWYASCGIGSYLWPKIRLHKTALGPAYQTHIHLGSSQNVGRHACRNDKNHHFAFFLHSHQFSFTVSRFINHLIRSSHFGMSFRDIIQA
jgi:hypothetical protein